MSTDALKKIDEIFIGIKNSLSEEMTANHDECERVLSWLCDKESREAYQRELIYIHLRLVFFDSFDLLHRFTVKPEEVTKSFELMRQLQEKKILPEFSTALPDGHSEFMAALTLTFVLNQYAYKDLVTIQKGDIVFDYGGYFGETFTWALQKGAATTYIFEPSPMNLPHIRSNIEAFEEQERMFLVPFALGAVSGVVPFGMYENSPAGSRVEQVTTENTVNVPQITLDDWCAEHKVVPDFIKMDIEGGEVDAIRGASHIIAKYKPRVAISLYHRISDMWVIPNMLKELCPEYRFWCRKYATDCEFVLYGSV